MSLSALYLHVYVFGGTSVSIMFARALLLDLSKEVIVPSCIRQEADILILIFLLNTA